MKNKQWILQSPIYVHCKKHFRPRCASKVEPEKLIDGSGNTVVEYTYDSWGKPIGVTGTLANTLGANHRRVIDETSKNW